MRAPSIAEIAAHNERVGGHYFDRGTLKFFGQRRADFRSRVLKDGRIIVYAYESRGWGISFGSKPSSLAVYDPATGEVRTPHDAEALKEQFKAVATA